MSTNSLVLGGNGFIGSHLVDRLLLEKHNVRVFDRGYSPFRNNIDGVEYWLGDFNDYKKLNESLDNIDIVFHLISTTNPVSSNKNPLFDASSNLINTIKLLELCVEKKIKKIIYLSSGGAIYGLPDQLPVSEEGRKKPRSSYGIIKLACEQYCDLFNMQSGLEYVVIRPSNPYGIRQDPKKGQGVIAAFLNNIMERRPLEIWGDGSIVKDYIHVVDLVDGIYKGSITTSVSNVFNLGSGVGTTVNQLIDLIRAIVDVEIKVNYRPEFKQDVSRIYLDCTRAERELGWTAKTSLADGIKEQWGFINSMI